MKSTNSLLEKIKNILTVANFLALPAFLLAIYGIYDISEKDRKNIISERQAIEQLNLAKQQYSQSVDQAIAARSASEAAFGLADQARRHADEARLQTEILSKQSAAAEKASVELARQNNLYERNISVQYFFEYQRLRPRLEFVRIDKDFAFKSDGTSDWVAVFENKGSSPPNVVWQNADNRIIGRNENIDEIPNCSQTYRRGEFGTGIIPVTGIKLNRDQIRELDFNGSLGYAMFGRMCYYDDEGGLHSTSFCSVLRGNNRNWVTSPCSSTHGAETIIWPPKFEAVRNSLKSK
jgi:hypothetical protein